jgi:hypothetical protein
VRHARDGASDAARSRSASFARAYRPLQIDQFIGDVCPDLGPVRALLQHDGRVVSS